MTDKTREDVVEAVARAIATKTYAYCTVTEEGSDQYDCGEWEEFGSDAKATYIAAAEAALAALNTRPDVEAWQPIETVPNDGSWGVVGCWVVDDDGEQAAWWSAWTAPFDGTSLGEDGTWGDPPTHWCWYPSPPPLSNKGESRG